MARLHKVGLAALLAQSRELKAEARNLRMMLQYLRRSYPMRGGLGPAADPAQEDPPPADKSAPRGRRPRRR